MAFIIYSLSSCLPLSLLHISFPTFRLDTESFCCFTKKKCSDFCGVVVSQRHGSDTLRLLEASSNPLSLAATANPASGSEQQQHQERWKRRG